MSIIIRSLFFTLCFISMNSQAQTLTKNIFSWKQLDPIPDADGFAGSYAGVSNNSLIVAGGANFPGNKRPWSNGIKTWYDKIFVLENSESKWKEIGKLPRPMGYGVSITWKDKFICIGGGDAQQNYAEVFIINYNAGKIEIQTLPSMPQPLSNACGAIINDAVYVFGGIHSPADSTNKNFLKLDLSKPLMDQKWEVLKEFPGKSRMLSMAGAQDGKFYLFGGVHLVVSSTDTVLHREYLKDCWEYSNENGWKQIADLPQPLAAAPSPAFNEMKSDLVLFGGDDGEKAALVSTLKDAHPGFRNEILSYSIINNSWYVTGMMPVQKNNDSVSNPHGSVYAPVITPLVVWNDAIIIPGGEARPAVRSNKVLVASAIQSEETKRKKKNYAAGIFIAAVLLLCFIISRKMN